MVSNLTSQTITALPRSHPHTLRYNFDTIPVPAPAVVTQKYQHLQQQTPSLSEHHHIPQDSWGGCKGWRTGGRRSTAAVKKEESTEKIQTLILQFY